MAISEVKAMFIVMNFIYDETNGGTEGFFVWNQYSISGEHRYQNVSLTVTAYEQEESMEEYNGAGRQNADHWKVYKFEIEGHTFFIRFSGTYTSHYGAKFESIDLVQPVPVATTIFEAVE